jgi:hypothetical protein
MQGRAAAVGSRLRIASIAAALFLCLALLESAAAEEAVGAVARVSGAAEAEAKPATRKLAEGSPIYLNDLLRTGENSRLTLVLGGRTSLRLGSLAKLHIDRFIVDAGGDFNLEGGPLLLDAQAGSFQKGLEVHSPFALIAVRGTSFYAGPLDGGFAVFVRHGEVAIRAGGTELRLGAGQGSTIRRIGGRPGPRQTWSAAKIARAMAQVE